MTAITLDSGKVVIRSGKVGTQQACCCCACPDCTLTSSTGDDIAPCVTPLSDFSPDVCVNTRGPSGYTFQGYTGETIDLGQPFGVNVVRVFIEVFITFNLICIYNANTNSLQIVAQASYSATTKKERSAQKNCLSGLVLISEASVLKTKDIVLDETPCGQSFESDTYTLSFSGSDSGWQTVSSQGTLDPSCAGDHSISRTITRDCDP